MRRMSGQRSRVAARCSEEGRETGVACGSQASSDSLTTSSALLFPSGSASPVPRPRAELCFEGHSPSILKPLRTKNFNVERHMRPVHMCARTMPTSTNFSGLASVHKIPWQRVVVVVAVLLLHLVLALVVILVRVLALLTLVEA